MLFLTSFASFTCFLATVAPIQARLWTNTEDAKRELVLDGDLSWAQYNPWFAAAVYEQPPEGCTVTQVSYSSSCDITS